MRNEQLFLDLLDKEEVYDKIVELYCELDKKRFTEGGMSGWSYTIILDKDGDVDYTYSSNNSTRQDVYNGDAITVASLDSFVEVSTDDMGSVEDVIDIEEFKNHLINEFYYLSELEPGTKEYIEKEREYVDSKLTWMDYYEFNIEGFQAVELETWECICDNYSREMISDRISATIENLRLQVNV